MNKIDLTWFKHGKIDWVVIGAQTRPQVNPRIEWVKNLVEACNRAGVKFWLKDNLYKLLMEASAEDHDLYWEDMAHLRQEFPQ